MYLNRQSRVVVAHARVQQPPAHGVGRWRRGAAAESEGPGQICLLCLFCGATRR